MDNIVLEIKNKLIETEKSQNVKIPLAIESGSRGWGFASPDSDYDCRFIYVHEKDWYVRVTEKKDFIEYAADEVFDINGWDLKKVIQHIIKSNAVIYEWLSSNEIYIKNKLVAEELDNLAKHFFNPVSACYHYLSIAKNKFNEVIYYPDAKLKNYFYIMRPLANLDYIQKYKKMPYMEYEKTLSEIEIDQNILNEIKETTNIKKVSNESYKVQQNKILLDYFSNEIEKHTEILKNMKFEKNKDYSEVDNTFRKIIELVQV